MNDRLSLHSLIENHPALAGKDIPQRLGLSLPDLSDPLDIAVSEENRPLLARMGIRIEGPVGTGNIVTVERGMIPVKLAIRFHHWRDNHVIIENGSKLDGGIVFEGNGHLFVCSAAGDKPFLINAMVRRNESAIVIGRGSTANSRINLWIEGPHTALVIGDDCLFSWGIWLRCADSHGIIDVATQKLINPPEDVEIGSHSWIGQEAIVMKGVTLGPGSIVAARAVVTKSCSPCALIGGVPARMIREGVSWTRRAVPSEPEISNVIDALRRFSPDIAGEQGDPSV